MKILVTGAGGFLGRRVVAEALARSHEVRALLRPASDASSLPWREHAHVELARADLRDRKALHQVTAGVGCVIHTAAQMSGDFYSQFEGTVVATENLLEALKQTGGARLVLVSSFSVYGYLERKSFATLDEESPLERFIDERDDYAYTKLAQEKITREYAREQGWPLVVLRPGVIYGPRKTFGARLGVRVSEGLWLRIGAMAQIPVTYVESCAQAIVLAAEKEAAIGETFNVLDDNPPTTRQFAAELRRRATRRPRVIPVPWVIVRAMARMAWLVNRGLLGGRAKLPGLFVPARVHARFKPLRYSNRKIRERLGWAPRYSLREALDRCFLPDEGA